MPVLEDDIVLDKPYIEKRVKDWEKRVYQFYAAIKELLSSNKEYKIQVNADLTLTMNEELMYRFGVHPIEIKTASIVSIRKNKVVATVKPFGLWIIGANGAIEISTFLRAYKIIDTAEKFKTPHWHIVNRKGFEESMKPFTKQELIKILDQAYELT